MKPLQSNRDLYLAITELTRQHAGATASLEQFLRSLLAATEQRRHHSALSLTAFYELICEAYATAPAPFLERWRTDYERLPFDHPGFDGFRATLIKQIVDLREMEEAGLFASEGLYLGVDSPRGGTWYNFDPATYLECATEGAFGGWEPGDESRRGFVPGDVAYLDADGEIRTAPAQDFDDPEYVIPSVSWEKFRDFLECGQEYE